MLLSVFCLAATAPEVATVKLPSPQTDIGMPLMQVLKERHSARGFANKSLPAQELSNLLWAAFGINREDSGKRTAPSAMNAQEIDIYVADYARRVPRRSSKGSHSPVVSKRLWKISENLTGL